MEKKIRSRSGVRCLPGSSDDSSVYTPVLESFLTFPADEKKGGRLVKEIQEKMARDSKRVKRKTATYQAIKT